MTDEAFQQYVSSCRDELQRKQQAIAETLVLTPDPAFNGRGPLLYRAGQRPALQAQTLALGSRGLGSGTWLWAWANQGFDGVPMAATQALRDLAARTGHAGFASDRPQPCTDAEAWAFAAVACHELDGAGVVRFTVNQSDWFFMLSALQRHLSEARLVRLAEAAVRKSLRRARGPGLLNVLRQRFPALRVDLVDADLRGAPQPWAHDLHVQLLGEQDDMMVRASRQMAPDQAVRPGRFGQRQFHDLSGARLQHANLAGAILRGVTLRGASLEGASLVDADLSRADLRGANLRSAFLNGANLSGACLIDADLHGAELSRTLLADVDLSRVRGLDDVRHLGPSEISMSTLVTSGFQIEPRFLRRAGVSRGLIQDLRRGKRFAGSYETCFLSYSSQDREFATRLYAALGAAGVRVYWDHFELVPGESLEGQIAEAIQESRRLVVVLSAASLASEWVEREIRLARAHRPESLMPIRLCPIEAVKAWTAAKPDRPDLAEMMPVQDFSGWQTEADFGHALGLLLKGLGGGGVPP